jgi:hypothetical protein
MSYIIRHVVHRLLPNSYALIYDIMVTYHSSSSSCVFFDMFSLPWKRNMILLTDLMKALAGSGSVNGSQNATI